MKMRCSPIENGAVPFFYAVFGFVLALRFVKAAVSLEEIEVFIWRCFMKFETKELTKNK